jgi:hypothetical protein
MRFVLFAVCSAWFLPPLPKTSPILSQAELCIRFADEDGFGTLPLPPIELAIELSGFSIMFKTLNVPVSESCFPKSASVESDLIIKSKDFITPLNTGTSMLEIWAVNAAVSAFSIEYS